jgi:hypothetical protein
MAALVSERRLLMLVAGAMTLMMALATWSWALGMDHAPLRLLTGVAMIALWGFVEWRVPMQCAVQGSGAGVIRWHRAVFATIGLFIAMRHGVRLAFYLQYLDPEWVPVARRGLHVVAGGVMAVWGNYLPKLMSPWQPEDERFDWQGVHRFAGWAFTIGGVATMLTWVALPIDQADAWEPAIVGCVALLAVGRKLYSLATHSGPRGRAESRPL